MSSDISTIIFDLDGTLADTLPDIADAANYALRAVGCDEQSYESIRACIGGGAKNLIRRALGVEHAELFEETLRIFSARYAEHVVDKTLLYPEVKSVLEYFYGKKRLALATFKSRQGTMKILGHFGILKFFDIIITVDDVANPKPHPECLEKVLAFYHIGPEEAVYIGDTVTDIATGKNAGMQTCAVTYGFGTADEVLYLNPNYAVDSFSGLKAIF